ncbi:MAG: domain containing protein [Candidatus Taylorbacteria bacterium]|nr:domain containing protein [Candidatus Taylorbacteria bacterium]
MITPEILNFVRSEISRGVSRDEITRELSSQGWLIEDIQEAFQSMNSAAANTQNTAMASNQLYATFLRRLVAHLIDVSLVVVLSNLFSSLVISPMVFPWMNNIVINLTTQGSVESIFFNLFKIWGTAMVVGLTVGLIFYLMYYTLFNASKLQATPGKIILGLRVVDKNGERISILRAISRAAASIISVAILNIGYLFPLFTERKQTLHDIIASTVVVDTKRRSKLFVFLSFISLIILSVIYKNYIIESTKESINDQRRAVTENKPQLTLNDAQKEEIRSAVEELHKIVGMNNTAKMREYLVSSRADKMRKIDMESSPESYVTSIISRYSATLETINENTISGQNIAWMPFFDYATHEPTHVVLIDISAEEKGRMVRLSFIKVGGLWKSELINM